MRSAQHPGAWFLEAFGSLGIDTSALLRAVPRELAAGLHHPESTTSDDVNRILLAAAKLAGDDHIGLRLAESLDLAAIGTYGYLLLNARTIGECLELAARYYPIFYRGAALELSRLRRFSRLAYRRTDVTTLDDRHDNEWTLGTIIQIIRRKLHSDWQPMRTTFTHGAPADAAPLRRLFGPDIRFGHAFNCFELDNAVLKQRLSDADPALLKVVLEHADSLLHSYVNTQSIESQVRLTIMAQIESGTPTARSVARQMGLSLTTLKRRLAERHVTFRMLRDGVIGDLAKSALAETNVNVGTLALQLGYSEASAFNHAFLRIVGMSPSDYRRSASPPGG